MITLARRHGRRPTAVRRGRSSHRRVRMFLHPDERFLRRERRRLNVMMLDALPMIGCAALQHVRCNLHATPTRLFSVRTHDGTAW